MKWRLLLLTFGGTVGAATGAACSSSRGDATTAPTQDAGAEAQAPAPDEDTPANDPSCPPSGVSKGPWSIAMTRTGVRVRWEACRADAKGAIVVHPESGGDETRVETTSTEARIAMRHDAPLNAQFCPDDAPGSYWLHEAALEGLT